MRTEFKEDDIRLERSAITLSWTRKTGYFLMAMRPLHWVKNVFVLVAIVFSGKLLDLNTIWDNLEALGVFCMAASAVYLINDVFDRKDDARHPSKRMRPITRGLVSIQNALFGAVVLGFGSVVLGFAIDQKFGMVIAAYGALNLLYSIAFKKVIIFDVMVIGIGFVLRVLGGAAVTGYRLSSWMLIATFFLSTLIAFSKRRYEIVYDGTSPLHARGYTPYFLDLLVILSAGSVITSYAFYALYRGSWQNGFALLSSIAVVFYGVLRYVYLIHRTEEQLDHTRLILSDWPLMTAVMIWIGLFITEIYYVNPGITLP